MDLSGGTSAIRFAAVLLGRALVLAVLWLVLVNGATSSWWIGIPVVVLAALSTQPSRPSMPIIWWEVLRFIPFFLRRSLSGGMDVARRALHPRLPLDPALIQYPLRLPQGLPQAVMANLVNLLPGTLTAELTDSALQVHLIDQHAPFFEELEAVESAVARIFGITLTQPER